MSAADDWNSIYHSHPDDEFGGRPHPDSPRAHTTPAWEDMANWAKYLALGHVVMLSDETGTVVTVAEEVLGLGDLRVAQVVCSFDLVGGGK